MEETTELLKGLVKMAEQYKLTENSSIEKALAQAKSGDTLLLEPGDYVAEKLNLTQINIIGQGQSPDDVTLDALHVDFGESVALTNLTIYGELELPGLELENDKENSIASYQNGTMSLTNCKILTRGVHHLKAGGDFFKTNAHELSNITAGDVLLFEKGEYDLDAIKFSNSLTLTSESGNAADVIINGQLQIDSPVFVLNSLTFTGTNSDKSWRGTAVMNGNRPVELTVNGCIFQDNEQPDQPALVVQQPQSETTLMNCQIAPSVDLRQGSEVMNFDISGDLVAYQCQFDSVALFHGGRQTIRQSRFSRPLSLRAGSEFVAKNCEFNYQIELEENSSMDINDCLLENSATHVFVIYGDSPEPINVRSSSFAPDCAVLWIDVKSRPDLNIDVENADESEAVVYAASDERGQIGKLNVSPTTNLICINAKDYDVQAAYQQLVDQLKQAPDE